ncbi:MAG: Fe-S cluster assembly ATPase SufC [Planctomycetes bacterium]|nr:Fe-S cluster assembly ATPase SufC [Planctomycetota bacterium]
MVEYGSPDQIIHNPREQYTQSLVSVLAIVKAEAGDSDRAPVLAARNITAAYDNTNMVLQDVSIDLHAGQTLSVVGESGSGKSTLANTIAGHQGYDVISGTVTYKDLDLLALDPSERAAEGVFLGFQYPIEIPGISNMNFLRTALNSIRRYRGEEEMSAAEFLGLLREKAAALGISNDMLKRAVNVGFSGGERKRNEMLQMAVLDPQFAVLDETDSGLDIDALKIVARGINAFHGADKGLLLITHYKRLLSYVKPDVIHVLIDGRIAQSGDKELAEELEEAGYAAFA